MQILVVAKSLKNATRARAIFLKSNRKAQDKTIDRLIKIRSAARVKAKYVLTAKDKTGKVIRLAKVRSKIDGLFLKRRVKGLNRRLKVGKFRFSLKKIS